MGLLAPESTADERMRAHQILVEHGARHGPASTRRADVARKRFRGDRRAEGEAYFWEIVRDVLWAAGVVETRAMFRAPGVVGVYPESMLPREALRADQECEILEAAERCLRSAGYRVRLLLEMEPPRLYCTTPRAEVDLFG